MTQCKRERSTLKRLCRQAVDVDFDGGTFASDGELFLLREIEPPEEIILDYDATDDLIHGKQQGRFFNGFYDGYCYLPLSVFCGDQLLVSYLRPCNVGAAHHARPVTKLLVEKIRSRWPNVKIILRGDSGFTSERTFDAMVRQERQVVVFREDAFALGWPLILLLAFICVLRTFAVLASSVAACPHPGTARRKRCLPVRCDLQMTP